MIRFKLFTMFARLVLSTAEFERRDRRFTAGWGFRMFGRDWFSPEYFT